MAVRMVTLLVPRLAMRKVTQTAPPTDRQMEMRTGPEDFGWGHSRATWMATMLGATMDCLWVAPQDSASATPGSGDSWWVRPRVTSSVQEGLRRGQRRETRMVRGEPQTAMPKEWQMAVRMVTLLVPRLAMRKVTQTAPPTDRQMEMRTGPE
eukprot:Hpha_TRINITY_DN15007_c0_g2::TRINITY_DN15007_c0_g2_i1::g.124118::m.124118